MIFRVKMGSIKRDSAINTRDQYHGMKEDEDGEGDEGGETEGGVEEDGEVVGDDDEVVGDANQGEDK